MIPEKVFERILALGDAWRVASMNYSKEENKVLVRVEETAQLWNSVVCPHCGAKGVGCHDHAPERRWRHLDVWQIKSEIACSLPRGRCPQCQAIFTVRAPWEGRGKGLTQEFEAYALTLMREMPVKRVAEIIDTTDTRLWRMLLAHVEAAWAELSWENVVWVGADEMNRRKGHNYLTVFVDLVAKRVLLAVEGKDAGVWEQFVGQLARHQGHPKAITQVAIDMSPAYKKGVRENLPNAAVCFDKFHVLSHAVGAVDEVRRLEAASTASATEALEKTRWLLLKNPENWTERQAQRWEQIKQAPLVTGLAYAMRLDLQTAYSSTTAPQARKRFEQWCGWVRDMAAEMKAGLLEPMLKVARMVEEHLEGILGHWKAGLTTAFLEGLNSLFSATKRKARGYRTSRYQIAMLYFVAGKLEVPHY
jgi:transposase